jgi:hypothetical protein
VPRSGISATSAARTCYASLRTWREDDRRLSNREQVSRVAGLAMVAKRSVDFTGYCQRHIAD